jgi:hypothetical protein
MNNVDTIISLQMYNNTPINYYRGVYNRTNG